MDLRRNTNPRRGSAFTIIEAIVSAGIVGILVLALYSGMTSTTFAVRLARENLRATEIMLEKTECLRLFSWEQLTNSTFVPTNFTAYYYDNGATNGIGTGITYSGSFFLSTFPSADRNYSNDMRLLTMDVTWTSGGIARSRTMKTYCARYGIQNYVIQQQ